MPESLQHQPGAPAALDRRPLPAWPFEVLCWGLPLWWVMGLMPFIVVMIGAVMTVFLLARRGLRVVPGVGPWFGLLAWILPCGLMLDSASRFIGYLQRGSNYLAIGVIVLYLINARERLPTRRVVSALTALWVFVVIGGYLGSFFPYVRLATPVGLLLPDSLTSNEYVHDLLFPPFAEIQTPWGAPHPYERPSAPFPYANSWGSAIALLTPAVFAQIANTSSRRGRVALLCCVAAAVVPITQALNRGMLIVLAITISYVAIRLMLQGRALPFLGLTVVGTTTAGVLAAIGFFHRLVARAELGSNDTRIELYTETLRRTLDSPVFGYGAPRPSDLTGLSVGTQGQVWYLLFSFGFVGLTLFLWFLASAVVRGWSVRRWEQLWLHGALLGACFMIFFYGLGTFQLLTVVVVATVLLRDRAVPRQHTTGVPDDVGKPRAGALTP